MEGVLVTSKRRSIPVQLPLEFASDPDLKAAWEEWEQHLRELRKPLTPTRARKHIQAVLKIPAHNRVASIEHSIASGWQSIYPRPGAKDSRLAYHELNERLEHCRARRDLLRGMYQVDTAAGRQAHPEQGEEYLQLMKRIEELRTELAAAS